MNGSHALSFENCRCGFATFAARVSMMVFALGLLLLAHAWRVARRTGLADNRPATLKVFHPKTTQTP